MPCRGVCLQYLSCVNGPILNQIIHTHAVDGHVLKEVGARYCAHHHINQKASKHAQGTPQHPHSTIAQPPDHRRTHPAPFTPIDSPKQHHVPTACIKQRTHHITPHRLTLHTLARAPGTRPTDRSVRSSSCPSCQSSTSCCSCCPDRPAPLPRPGLPGPRQRDRPPSPSRRDRISSPSCVFSSSCGSDCGRRPCSWRCGRAAGRPFLQ
mmetsp:Transcript_22336/g.55052  ORF Transcript_22336/g.55052 Transcript_22336/m.55052 type:complete len:208 (+) Transcript_22336:604-1227(+)